MVEVTKNILDRVKAQMRIATDLYDDEITGLIIAGAETLEARGLTNIKLDDNLTFQTIVFFVKAHYGFEDKREDWLERFDSMATHLSRVIKYRGEYDEI